MSIGEPAGRGCDFASIAAAKGPPVRVVEPKDECPVKKTVKWSAILLLGVVLFLLWKYLAGSISFDQVRENREMLRQFVADHYYQSVGAFVLIYLMTALFLPGALVLTVTGGMLFGTFPAVLYVNIAATTGATLAFLLSRSLLGRWIHERFKRQLERFNREMGRHGHNYLLTLRLVPVVPFFVVNYGAGISGIPLRTFLWTTSLGMLPGSVVYSFAGNQFGAVESPEGLLSWPIVVALLLLALFALLPVIRHHVEARRG